MGRPSQDPPELRAEAVKVVKSFHPVSTPRCASSCRSREVSVLGTQLATW
jgi:hypothetical protein